MTKKNNPLENPPAASSSDDEEEALDSEEEQEDDDAAASSSSSSEEDQPKPPSSSAAETDSESKKEKSPPPPATKSGTKRPSEVTSKEKTNSKRAKKTGGEEDTKKPPPPPAAAFHRLWTEEDEIAVLQGMIDFKEETGNSPYDDTNAYYDYIKKSISFDVTKNQFMDKLRGLKKKYMGKEKKPSFTRPHEQKSYRLCKYIWGPDGMGLDSAVKSNNNNGVVSKKKSRKVDSVKKELSFVSPNGKTVEDGEKKHDWFENSFLVRGIAGFGVDESYVKQRWRMVPVETKKRVEEKVKMLQAKEIEFVLQKTEVLRDVTAMIAEASKNKSH